MIHHLHYKNACQGQDLNIFDLCNLDLTVRFLLDFSGNIDLTFF